MEREGWGDKAVGEEEQRRGGTNREGEGGTERESGEQRRK